MAKDVKGIKIKASIDDDNKDKLLEKVDDKNVRHVIEEVLSSIKFDFSLDAKPGEMPHPEKVTLDELLSGNRDLDFTGGDLRDVIESDKPFVTLDEKAKEDIALTGQKLKKSIYDANKKNVDAVDSMLSPSVNMLSGLASDLETDFSKLLFDKMLNKVSMMDLLKFLISCSPVLPGPMISFNMDLFPKIPTINLTAAIDISLKQIVMTIFESLYTMIMDLSSDMCSLGLEAGVASLKDLMKGDSPAADLLKAFVDAGIVEIADEPTDERETLAAIGKYIDLVSAALCPAELAKLIAGTPTEKTAKILAVVNDIADVPFKDALQNADMIPLFTRIGDNVDDEGLQSFLDECRGTGVDVVGTRFVCPDVVALQEELLRDRGLTPQEAKNALDRLQKRADDKNKIIDNLKKAVDSSEPLDLCNPSVAGIPNALPKTKMPESVQRQLDSTMNTVFDGVYVSFDDEANKWSNALIIRNLTTESINRDFSVVKEKMLGQTLRRLIRKNIKLSSYKPNPAWALKSSLMLSRRSPLVFLKIGSEWTLRL